MATLLYHWKLDEGSGQYAYSSASANTGTVYDSTAGDRNVEWEADGYSNSGVVGDGTDGTAADNGIITSEAIDGLPIDFTVMCWFKTTHPTNEVTNPLVALLLDSNTAFGHAIWMEPGNAGTLVIKAGIYASGLGRYVVSTPFAGNLATGEWIHVAFTCNSSTDTIAVYIDCREDLGGSLVVPADIVSGAGTCRWYIAGGQCPVNYMRKAGAFDGSIDDVRVYDGYMTAEEVCAAKDDFPARVTNAIMFSCNT
jgi:hypothetical protein